MNEFNGMTIDAKAPIRMNYGGQAFPNEGFNGWGEPEKGMTLRDYFAAKAMHGLVASPHMPDGFNVQPVADKAYLLADAMLKARGG